EFPEALRAIARAGAGTNNIPIDRCSEAGIVVFNTPGANANAVKELVLAALLISSRDILGGAEWVQEQIHTPNVDLPAAVEKNKSTFTGPELRHKVLGVIGLGAIGVLVANAALDLGMDVIGYDPFLSLENAWHLSPSVEREESIEDVVAKADYITLHIPLNDKTKHTFNEKLFSVTKPGARLLNFARGGLVDNDALKKAIADGIIARYMTDFPSEDLLGDPWNIITTPHIGASTPESEENCAIMAAQEIRDYLTYGNIKNSVNFPRCEVPYNGKPRIAISHKNIVNMIGQLGAVFTKYHVNIDKLVNNSKGELAYNIVVCDTLPENVNEMIEDLYAINTVLKVRVLG
ncbi:MAG: 3-phosphoglycerate dehydrogenase, partial [Anaerotignum sp.]|nr:3-phosphoglycerate dehydrogenase [Anaerotignum sp.]